LILTCCCSHSARRRVSTLHGLQVCFAFDGESQESMGGPQGPLHFLRVFLQGCRRRSALEGMSLDRRWADWQQHHGGICPPGFGEQLQGMGLYETKKTLQNNLLTEYDCPPSHKKPSLVDKILDGVQFNLEKDASPTVL
jgi:hypothetical protein